MIQQKRKKYRWPVRLPRIERIVARPDAPVDHFQASIGAL